MVTAEELTVALRSEGVSETQDDLKGVERTMDDTANSAGNSAEELEGFSQRFQGAMSAAVAALAVGAAGLLSQVPVLGESMAGLFAIVEALAFQMDSVLRPVLSPITDFFFMIADAIFEADGAMGTIIGAVASFISIAVVVITTVAAIGSALGVWASTTGGVIAILGALAKIVIGVISTLAGLISLPALIIAAFVALAAALIFNVGGARDRLGEIIGDIWNFFVELASDLSEWAGDLASDAFEWGRNLIDRFIDGIRAAIGRLREFLGDLRDIGANVGISVPDLGGLGGGGGGNGGGASSRPRFGAATGGGNGGSQIDGRQITESTGRYRSGSPNRRGL